MLSRRVTHTTPRRCSLSHFKSPCLLNRLSFWCVCVAAFVWSRSLCYKYWIPLSRPQNRQRLLCNYDMSFHFKYTDITKRMGVICKVLFCVSISLWHNSYCQRSKLTFQTEFCNTNALKYLIIFVPIYHYVGSYVLYFIWMRTEECHQEWIVYSINANVMLSPSVYIEIFIRKLTIINTRLLHGHIFSHCLFPFRLTWN